MQPFSTETARARGYTRLRAFGETVLDLLYVGDWPAALWARFPGSCDVVTRFHELALLPPGSKPLRVGLITDIHIGPTTPLRLLECAFDLLAAAKLDMLLLGGDYVYLEATREKAKLLADLTGRVPAARKYAVMGNHDLWTAHKLLEEELTDRGVRVLCNENVTLSLGTTRIALLGLDDPWAGAPDLQAAIAGAEDAETVIVLCHASDEMPKVRKALEARGQRHQALYLCGHTHGGHIATPWGPIVVPGTLGRRYPHGLHDLAPLYLYVSRGVGGIELPIRTYAPPEVAIFDLTAST
jgi:uncharacterized protein